MSEGFKVIDRRGETEEVPTQEPATKEEMLTQIRNTIRVMEAAVRPYDQVRANRSIFVMRQVLDLVLKTDV